jgi:peptidoglycan/LPS O-acetylase OafA/YrhL
MATSEAIGGAILSTPVYGVSTGEDRNLKNLDVLRAIAVFCVVACHAAPLTPIANQYVIATAIGRFGVITFFVHTALVLMLSMERSGTQPGWVHRFYVQRAARIYPLAWLCIAAVLICHASPGLKAPFSTPSIGNMLANLSLTQNIFGSSSISGPLWSLPFEVQMYLLLPGIFWLVRREGISAALLLLLGSVIIAITEKAISPPGQRLTEFFPCFIGGVIAYAGARSRGSIPAVIWPLALLLTVFAFCMLCVWSKSLNPFLEWLTCIVLGIALPFFREMRASWATRAAETVARYSYALYLSHLPLLWLCFERLRAAQWQRWLTFLVLACLIPPLLYHGLEAPMIRAGKKLAHQLPRGCLCFS